ncbi:P-loop NTPase [Azospirillum agricola]|uniref:P-loop NTPase n=1 Tax=Azospirillum agricola TaxID=1720247 RepID=UPI000A0F168B|nr:hypothetical protein [Azospirillum agricola]SMH53052.1 hypothetical protein SAMN02982994_3272 [Azospirillum lipoferum]
MLKSLSTLHRTWTEKHRSSAEGGRNALQGFRYQTLLAIAKALDIHRAKARDRIRADVLTEHLSDLCVIADKPSIVQVKRTLDATKLKKALRELWTIHEVASDSTPELLEAAVGLTYGVSARFDRCGDPRATIDGWTPDTAASQERIDDFKRRLTVRFEVDPENEIFERLANDFHDPFPRRTLNVWLGEEFNGSETEVGRLMQRVTDKLVELRQARAEERRPAELMLVREADEPPPDTLRHDGVGRAVLTGEAPKLDHLRRGFFAPRAVYRDLVDQAESWIETRTERWDPTDGTLRMLWLQGRSGTGKSVALLHMMTALRKRRHGPVLWIGNTIRQLPTAMRIALDLAAAQDVQPIIVVDDPYAPNAVDAPFTFWDEAYSLLEARENGARLPLILACGPGEQIDVCEGDLTADRIAIDRLPLPLEDAAERQSLRLWYRDRTGEDPPRYAEGEDVLLVQLFHDWAHRERLDHFADRFRNRIRAMAAVGLEDLFSQIIALNRLYVGYPDAALERLDDRIQGCIAQLTEEFHLAIHDGEDGTALGRPGVWLKHPHLSNVIYDRWFNPDSPSQRPVRNGHLRDATLAAQQHGRTPQQRTAPLWTISRGSSLEGVDLTGRLSVKDALDVLLQVYRRLDDTRNDLSRLPVWIEIERRFPELRLDPSPWRTALGQLAGATPADKGLRLTARHLLKTAKGLGDAERRQIETAVGDLLERFADTGWHDWRPLAIEATFTTGNPRFARLLARMFGSQGSASVSLEVSILLDRWPDDPDVTAAAIQWLDRVPTTSIGWSWIWEKVWSRASHDAALQRLSHRIADAWHTPPTFWSFIWERLWELSGGTPNLKLCALGWLGHIEPGHGSWKYVWEKLWEAAPGDRELDRQAREWLGRVQPDHGSWGFVWIKLWGTTPSDRELGRQAREWLGRVQPDHGSWNYVWVKLWEAAPGDRELDRQAREWLGRVEPNHGSWYYVWSKLWDTTPGDRELGRQAREWLGRVEPNHGSWKYVWERLWDAAPGNAELERQAREWLGHVELDHGSWGFVWIKLWGAAPDNAELERQAREWLGRVQPDHGSWGFVWIKLWDVAPGDGELEQQAREWLATVRPQHGSWNYVWEKLWCASPDHDLERLARAWLSKASYNHGSWKYVWRALWKAHPGDRDLTSAGRDALAATAGQDHKWDMIFLPMAEVLAASGVLPDSGMAEWARRWLARFPDHPQCKTVRRSLGGTGEAVPAKAPPS